MRKSQKFLFDVALSFAGEDRAYVEKTASFLARMGFRVFYDKYEKVTLWGKDLYTHLSDIYFRHARYTVIFISQHYAKKVWTNHERKSAQARAFLSKKEYILPARFDNTKLPGILPTTGYINLREIKPRQLAGLIKEKIGHFERFEFFPEDIDRLYSFFKAKDGEAKEEIFELTKAIFDDLCLMTEEERRILGIVLANACPGGERKNNFHIEMEYLMRLILLSKEQILSMFSRLSSFGFVASIYKYKPHWSTSKGVIKKCNEALEIRYCPRIVGFRGNYSFFLRGLFDCVATQACEQCKVKAFVNVDFSLLSSLAGFPEANVEPLSS